MISVYNNYVYLYTTGNATFSNILHFAVDTVLADVAVACPLFIHPWFGTTVLLTLCASDWLHFWCVNSGHPHHPPSLPYPPPPSLPYLPPPSPCAEITELYLIIQKPNQANAVSSGEPFEDYTKVSTLKPTIKVVVEGSVLVYIFALVIF